MADRFNLCSPYTTGALETDDTASETSSAPAPLRHQRPSSDSEQEEQDRLASLRSPNQPPQGRWGRPSIVPSHAPRGDGASSLGVAPPAAGLGSARASAGSLTPQRARTGATSDRDDLSASDSDTDEQEHGRTYPTQRHAAAARPSQGSYGPPPASRMAPAGGAVRYGPGPPSSVGRPGSISGGPSSRPGQSMQGGRPPAPRGPPPTASRYPAPPRSESNAGGGAGASLYSAIAPSRPPGAPVEHHYYHRSSESNHPGMPPGRAPSSVGGRSNHGGALPAAGGEGLARPEVDQALQSIQASLAALHERLNRVESGSGRAGASGSGAGGRLPTPLASAYRAVWNAFHDLSTLLGISSSSGTQAAAPSFGASGDAPGAPSGSGSASRRRRPVLTSLLSLLLSLVNLALRLTLDLTSLAILITVILFGIKKVTGRGDPLVLIRLMRRLLGSRSAARAAARLQNAPGGNVATAAVAAAGAGGAMARDLVAGGSGNAGGGKSHGAGAR